VTLAVVRDDLPKHQGGEGAPCVLSCVDAGSEFGLGVLLEIGRSAGRSDGFEILCCLAET
jgi:hypothetical protein